MAKWTPDQLSMFPLMTSEASPNATSSQALADGLMRSASPGGPMTDRSGPAPAPVSRSRSQAKAPVQTIQGTSGPTSTASSPPADPLSSWESKLQQRLASLGSTECLLTWKASVTPQGRRLFRLVPSMRPIEEIACGLWPTPVANDDNKSPEAHMAMKARMKGGPRNTITSLQVMAKAMWPTPTTTDAKRGVGTIRPQDTGIPLPQRVAQVIGTTTSGSPDQTGNRGALNPAFPCWLMGYPTAWDDYAPTATPSSRRLRQK